MSLLITSGNFNGMVMYALKIAGTRREANNTLSVELDVPEDLEDTFRFQPGQYLTLAADINGRRLRRSYSICSGVGEPLRVAIKKIDGGVFSAYAHEHFKPGLTVHTMPADGEFTSPIEPGEDKDYLCVAAGSGITPILSIIKSVLATQDNSRVTLLYGNRRTSTIIFRDELLWLKNAYMTRFQWINILSAEPQPAPILNGRINNKKGAELNQHLIDIKGYDEFFLCGPEGMISEVARGLRGFGVDESKIHYELFFASAADAKAALRKHRQRAQQYAGLTTWLTVRASGREVAFELTADGENILDGAMANGLDLPYSCKGGVCATCKAQVVEGQVDMDLHHALSAEEIDQGYVLTCQAHPISSKVVVDFDVI